MRFPTRPERLAAEREKRREESITAPPRLNPPYPYRATAFDPATLRARRVLTSDL